MDNPGWQDTHLKSDTTVFQEILQHLQTEQLHSVKAVVWCVTPQPRMDATLQAQARFIDTFTVGEDSGKIWSNVLIHCKKGKTDEDCQGAVMAAKNMCVHAAPRTLGYEFAAPEDVEGMSTELRLERHKLFTKAEALVALEQEVAALPPAIQVVFANQRCRACGQTGDPRLMVDRCHRVLRRGHTGGLDQRFSKVQVTQRKSCERRQEANPRWVLPALVLPALLDWWA